MNQPLRPTDGLVPSASADPSPNQTPTLKSRSSSGVIWGFIDAASQQVLSMVVFVILGRILSPALFGVVSTALVFVFLMRSTVLNAVSTSLVTLRKPTDEDYNTAFIMLVIISTTSVVILNILAKPLSLLYNIDQFDEVLRFTSIIILIFGLSYAHVGWARRNFQFKALALRNVAGVAAGGLGGIAVALAGYGIAALVVNQVLAGVVSLAMLWISIPWRPQFRFSTERARVLMRTALPLGMTQALQFAVQNFDTALVTYLIGPFGGGLYAAAKRIVLAIQLAIWQPISAVSLPAFTEILRDEVRVAQATVKAAGLVAAVTLPVFTAVGMTAEPLILSLFGPKWLAAAPVLLVLSLFGAVVPSLGVLHQIVIARGRSKAVLWFTLLQTIFVVVAVALAGGNSTRMIAICLTAPTLVTFILTLGYLVRIAPFPLQNYLAAICGPLIAASLMAGSMLSLPKLDNSFAMLAAQLVVGGSAYVFALWIVARSSFVEAVDFARALLPRSLRRKGTTT